MGSALRKIPTKRPLSELALCGRTVIILRMRCWGLAFSFFDWLPNMPSALLAGDRTRQSFVTPLPFFV